MTDTSFLPEDYLAKQAERRTNAISLGLFVVVMAAVFGAFLVTNRQASQIKGAQVSINQQFQDAAVKIEELNELEDQKERMLHKAELATALVERVPRSILLAELINRMPQRLSLVEFNIKSTPIKQATPRPTEQTKRLSGKGPERAKTREEAMEQQTIEAPRYEATITMVGIAPSDLEVAGYITELNAYPLLQSVTLKYSIQRDIESQIVREFRVEMTLDPAGDIRYIDPLLIPRELRDPMTGGGRLIAPSNPGDSTATVMPEFLEEN